ncbi:hypothetical protein L228DRAFT_149223 [Xylona heveae TC161]|uniref:Uncharacterized protein n=1 Tax=Xylona heveae (strain CBS 132557 / TC161) TaxID=1328760 RepID=A0A165GIZ5_XYLHT|nr:hypothetical protein L228DRAFT_149223 [Xylona heveae TC161]KZF22243.1 hypothetical protein L228DRAFT_149223 [Xylona heveae TC161]
MWHELDPLPPSKGELRNPEIENKINARKKPSPAPNCTNDKAVRIRREESEAGRTFQNPRDVSKNPHISPKTRKRSLKRQRSPEGAHPYRFAKKRASVPNQVKNRRQEAFRGPLIDKSATVSAPIPIPATSVPIEVEEEDDDDRIIKVKVDLGMSSDEEQSENDIVSDDSSVEIITSPPRPAKPMTIFAGHEDENEGLGDELFVASAPPPKWRKCRKETKDKSFSELVRDEQGRIDHRFDTGITAPMDRHDRLINRTDGAISTRFRQSKSFGERLMAISSAATERNDAGNDEKSRDNGQGRVALDRAPEFDWGTLLDRQRRRRQGEHLDRRHENRSGRSTWRSYDSYRPRPSLRRSEVSWWDSQEARRIEAMTRDDPLEEFAKN